jgi:catalase
LLGVHSVAWDEAQKISGKDPDFHRRDLWEAIEKGDFPEWELGLQIVPEKDEHKFPFDLLDPTKLIPEELVPVIRVGKMTLNRNPDNFFAETEQVAFHPGHLVPGIDFTNDPLLQGRLFSYTDTQLSRLGSPNFHEIPINRPIAPVHNNQRDGHMRQTINKGQSAYQPNTTGGGCPFQAKAADGGFTSFTERIDANKIRGRSESFFDHFSQATLFFHSQSPYEQQHIIHALQFELGKVENPEIRKRMLGLLSQVDEKLAAEVAEGLGMTVPVKPEMPMNHSIPADGIVKAYQPIAVKQTLKNSPALSMADTIHKGIETRQIAILAADGVDAASLNKMTEALEAAGAQTKVIAARLGFLKTQGGKEIKVGQSFLSASSVLFDAVFVPAGLKSGEALSANADAVHFINEAFKHCKALAFEGEGELLFKASYAGRHAMKEKTAETGIFVSDSGSKNLSKEFIRAISQHRFWERENHGKVPA